MIDIKIRFKGLAELIKKANGWRSAMPLNIAESVRAEAERIMDQDLKPNRVPVHTGKLRDSGKVEVEQITKDSARVKMTFGGPGIDYAVEVHEDTSRAHPHGQAKYLSGPMRNDHGQDIKEAILRGLSTTFSGGKK